MTTKAKFVEVVNVSDIKTDKNGRDYKIIAISQTEKEEVEPGIWADGKTRTTSFIAYKESNLDGKPEEGWNWKKGDKKLGSIETREVEPYTINEKVVDTYTCFIFGDTRKETFEKDVKNTFAYKKHPLKGVAQVKPIVVEDMFHVEENF